MGIVERYNQTLIEKLFPSQDASDLLTLHLYKRSRAWVKNLPTVVEDINNSITYQIGISPVEAIKNDEIIANPSKPRNGPIGYDEEQLFYNDLVRYLLEPGELEGGGRRRAGDMNWSPKVYHIQEALVQKNQPILYWLEDDDCYGPERSFVREELQVIPDNELPPQWVLSDSN